MQGNDPDAFNDESNEFLMFGPDFSIGIDQIEFNAQYIRRTDNNPVFAAGFDDDRLTEGIIGEIVINPFPDKSRYLGVLLYNKVTSELPGYEYETITGNISYMLRTNMRVLCELTRDMERKETIFTLGTTVGF